MKRAIRVTLAAFFLIFICVGSAIRAQETASRLEEIEWTWEVRPPQVDAKLPNVLLLGDSITRNYFPEVTRQLSGAANVYLMASSTSLGDPRLVRQIEEFSKAEAVRFSVVHFNNGMHGWAYSEKEYKDAFPALLAEIHAIAPKAALIWATTTSVKAEKEPGPTNARVVARNGIAESIVKAAGIPIDDQHGLMVQHPDLYEDSVHFNEQGANIQGKQAAAMIRGVLPHAQ